MVACERGRALYVNNKCCMCTPVGVHPHIDLPYQSPYRCLSPANAPPAGLVVRGVLRAFKVGMRLCGVVVPDNGEGVAAAVSEAAK